MSSNTLLKYFTKTPTSADKSSPKTGNKRKLFDGKENESTPKRPKAVKESTPASKNKTPKIIYKSDTEEEEGKDITPPEKRKRVFDIDSEGDASEDEFKPEEHAESSEDESLSEHSESEPDSVSEAEDGSPIKRDKKCRVPSKTVSRGKKTPSVTPAKSKSTLLQPSTPSTPGNKEGNGVIGGGDNWPHLKYDFLQPKRIKDIKMRPASNPDYDPRTLHVPEDFKNNQTPAMRQWWEMKAKFYDCILFFKVGKFYELYHMDAVTGANELSLLYMKGDFAHSGFPEVAYGKYAAALVDRGYKVARVEQTETPDMVTERCKNMSKPTKFDRVVRREICQLTSKGTRVFTVQDGQSVEADSQYLMAITEKDCEGRPLFGVCFVDTSIAVFHLGQFIDDKHYSRLRTLFAHYPPAQLLIERNQLSLGTKQVLNTSLSAVPKETLAPETEFWSATKTLTNLSERQYFEERTPESLKPFLSESDSLGLTANEESELALRALGAVTWYLRRCLLDHQLISMGQFTVYKPVDADLPTLKTDTSQINRISAKNMILDSVTLKNLHVLENSSGGNVGSLLYKLDNCSTPFGKRLLHQWLCSPLTGIKSIRARQCAITELIGKPELTAKLRSSLAKVPDLERLLSRIFAQSSRGENADHPDSRAIFFEEKQHSKKKISEFISILNGFHVAQEVAVTFQNSEIGLESDMLCQSSHFPTSNPPGKFPDLSEHLQFFKNAFDHDEASKEGHIIPSPGVDPDYDDSVATLKALEVKQNNYLKSQCEYFKCKVTFVGSDKKRFQLEMPEAASRRVSMAGYELQGQRKGFKKYHTVKTKELLEEQMKAEDMKKSVLQGLRKRIFSRFSERYSDWMAAAHSLAVLDVLMSFAEYSRRQEGDMCIPQFVPTENCEQPFVSLKNGSYPCTVGEEVFIPNDTVIGDKETSRSSLILVTGPNMGGKSTLMRQLGLITIMAHLGCRVPAENLELSPVDRIFTRLGANDDIMAGESTFYLELCETSSILAHATKHSLVLVDELGRGTSTYDGTAIAFAVLRQLTSMQSRTLFSTHYHSLVEDFRDSDNVALGHMACMAESEMEEEGEGVQENVTFLYKFSPGACPKSYGFNAARLAGIPAHITRQGYAHAKALEQENNLRKNFQTIFHREINTDICKQVISSL